MPAKEAAIRTVLTGNADWTSLVTGGTFLFDALGREGLTPQRASDLGCYDAAGKLKLTAVLTFEAGSEAEILTSERVFMRLWLYHHDSYGLIRQGRRKAIDLLDRKQVATDTEGAVLLRYADTMREFVAEELGGALGVSIRFFIKYRRQ